MSKTTIKPVSGTSSTKKYFTKFTPYNPSDYETYLSKLSSTEQKDFEQRVLFEKVWDEGFYQENFYTEEGSLKSKCGIYCIMNMIDRKKYFGESFRLNNRPKNHLFRLINDVHINKHLQSSFKKFGKENFIIFIVEFCNFKYLKRIECNYIETFGDLDDRFLYNLKKDDGVKTVISKETSDLMSSNRCNFYYFIQLPDESIIKINSLHRYCDINNVDFNSLSRTNLFGITKRKQYDTNSYFILYKGELNVTSEYNIYDTEFINELKTERIKKAVELKLNPTKCVSIIINDKNKLYTTTNYELFHIEHSINNLSKTFYSTKKTKDYHDKGFKIIKKFYGNYIFNEEIFRNEYSEIIDEFLKVMLDKENEKIKPKTVLKIYKYLIINPNMELIVAYSLREYCENNNIKYKSLYESFRLGRLHFKLHKILDKKYVNDDFIFFSEKEIEDYKNKLIINKK
jgi:hypothetical protein